MTRLPLSLAAFSLVASGCGAGAASIPPPVLAAADPAAAGAPYSEPANALAGPRPHVLGLEIGDPTRMHHPEPAPEIGTEHEHAGEDHSQHPTPTPTPKAGPGKRATPTPRPPVEAETTWACPMHPEVRDTKPGVCPKCNMRLEKVRKAAP